MTPFDPRASCAEKRRYSSLDRAEQVAREILRDRGTPLRAYQCSLCQGAHLTKCAVKVAQVEERPGWRPAKVSRRDEAQERKRERQRGRRSGRQR